MKVSPARRFGRGATHDELGAMINESGIKPHDFIIEWSNCATDLRKLRTCLEIAGYLDLCHQRITVFI